MKVFVQNLLRYFLLLIGTGIVVEQSFLHFYLDRGAIHDDEAFKSYIASLDLKNPSSNPNYSYGVNSFECQYKKIFWFYNFRMCLQGYGFDPANGMPRYRLRIAKPAGYLTVIPWEKIDRIAYDGADIFTLDNQGHVIEEMSK
jgi:hypothetical protein